MPPADSGSRTRTVPIARRLVAFALTAATLSLAGCGDSGDTGDDDSENDSSPATKTGYAHDWIATEHDMTRMLPTGCSQVSENR
jgi:hypothetical protein